MSSISKSPEYQVIRDEWTRVEEYNNAFLIPRDDALDVVRKHEKEQGLPDIAVAPNEGKFLYLLAKSIGAHRCLEVGTLGGYSTIWLARALPPDGRVVTFEIDEHHAQVARENWKTADVSDKISLILGPAAETLPKFDPKETFDLAFIDADKENNSLYFREAKRLLRKGGIIIVDNTVRSGKVANPSHQDSSSKGVRALFEEIQEDPDVETTNINTVGSKGMDGFLYALLK